ncbi:MAG: hypothetical protein ACM3ZC_05735, partial [Bacteroidota bacterium]
TGGLDAAGRQMLTQLMANNASLIQMLSTLADGKNAANLQPIYQMIANQNMLIQMLFTHLATGTSMPGMSGMAGGGGMGMM